MLDAEHGMYTKSYYDGEHRTLAVEPASPPATGPDSVGASFRTQPSLPPSSTSPPAASRPGAGRASSRRTSPSMPRTAKGASRSTRSKRRPAARSRASTLERRTSTRCGWAGQCSRRLSNKLNWCSWVNPSVPQDIAFLHAPTKTLIQADLLFNLPPTEQARPDYPP